MVKVSQQFSCKAEKIWSAITVHKQMLEWYFDNIPTFEPKVGFSTDFPVQSTTQIFHHIWNITEVIPEESISYEWTFQDIPGKGLVTFQLSGESIPTLTITDEVLEAFPSDIPEFKRESCEEGWKYFMGRLADFLA